MTDETMAYCPVVGQWDAGRPPTRREAVMLAAECASASTDNTISPQAGMARAASAQAWAAVAAVAEVEQPRVTVFVGTCGHHCSAMQIQPGGGWMHVSSLDPCDEPPGHARAVPIDADQ